MVATGAFACVFGLLLVGAVQAAPPSLVNCSLFANLYMFHACIKKLQWGTAMGQHVVVRRNSNPRKAPEAPLFFSEIPLRLPKQAGAGAGF